MLTRVTGGVIADQIVSTAKLADGAVAAAKLAPAAVGVAALADGAATIAKLAAAIKPEILIATVTAANVPALDVGGFDPALYRSYRIDLERVFPAGALPLWLRMSVDGGASFDAGAGDYRFSTFGNVATVGLVGSNSNGESRIELTATYSVGASADTGYTGTIRLADPGAAQRAVASFEGYFQQGGVNTSFVAGGGVRLAAARVDAVRIMAASGNVTGTARLYGTRL